MKFKFCGDLDCPDWLLLEIMNLSKLSTVKVRLLTLHCVKCILEEDKMDIVKVQQHLSNNDLNDNKSVIAALHFIIVQAAKYDTAPLTLSEEIQQLGLPKEHSGQIVKCYEENFQNLVILQKKQTVRNSFLSTSNDSSSLPRIEKKCRKQITLKEKESIITAMENNENLVHIADTLQISYNSVRSIVYKYKTSGSLTKGSRGGKRPKALKDEDGNRLLNYLEDYPDATLQDMSKHMEPFVKCSTSTIGRFLRGKVITTKKMRGSIMDKNSDYIKELRYKYLERMLKEEWTSKQIIYIDECGFNVWLRRPNGRSPKGQSMNLFIPPHVKGKNISLLLAISKNGPVHFTIIEGNFGHETYQNFITELSAKLPNTKHYFIQADASIHNNCISGSDQHEMVYLPPYSAFLNPIESVFSKLKCHVRNQTSLMDLNETSRLQYMQGLLTNELNGDQYKDLRPYYRQIRKFIFPVAEKKDIFEY